MPPSRTEREADRADRAFLGDLHDSASSRATSFEGRQRELSALANTFEGGARVVTVVGSPGVGKTRFAKEWVSTLSSDTQTHFCDLRGASDENALVTELAQRLGIQVSPNSNVASQPLQAALTARGSCLVVLDNFEALVDTSARLISEWVAAAPTVRFLITSRRVLDLHCETVFELPPLPLPAEDPSTWPRNDAVRLFLRRAEDAEPALRRDDATVRDAADLVRRLDGIPLALELAAAQVRPLGVRGVLQELRKTVLAFSHTARDSDPMHANLETTLLRSWALLRPTDRRSLALLSAFHRGFDLSGAAQVLGTSRMSAAGTLGRLREASLVHVRELESLGRRYDLYEAVREFASTRLSASERLPARQRHAEFFLAEGTTRMRAMDGPEGSDTRRWFREERANLVGAFSTLRDVGADSKRIASMALVLGRAFADWLPQEAMEALNTACTVDANDLPAELRAELLLARAVIQREGGHYGPAVADLSAVDDLLSQSDDTWSSTSDRAVFSAHLAYERGRLAFLSGQPSTALDLLRAALSKARSEIPAALVARIHYALARVLWDDFHHEAAVGHYARSVDAARRSGSQWLVVWAKIGWLTHRLAFQPSTTEKDFAALEQGWSTERSQSRTLDAWAKLGLTWPCLDAGRFDEAEQHAREAEQTATAAGLAWVRGLCAFAHGAIAGDRGNLDEALAHFDRAIEINEFHSNPRQLTMATLLKCSTLAQLDLVSEAERLMGEAARHLDRFGDVAWRPVLELVQSHIALAHAREAASTGDLRRSHQLEEGVRLCIRQASKPRIENGRELRPLVGTSLDARYLARVLQRQLETQAGQRVLRIAPDGSRFAVGSGPAVEIPKGRVTRSALAVLVERRCSDPGVPVQRAELLERCWPGEKMKPESEAHRVRETMKRLRRYGLEGLLLTGTPSGYLLDPDVPCRLDQSTTDI